jgi:ABC-2 type transport system ATP-binding protein
VLDDLSLNVPSGRVYGFLGRNGSGKTTTIRCLLGILRASAGEITYDGTTVRQTTTAMKRGIGYVSQQQHFYDWMTCNRIGTFVGAFYPTWDHNEYHRLLDALKVERTQRVGTLSGGTKMKLAMALALAHGPKLLILDEPTAGVDPVARAEILEALREQVEQHGRTVLFSTHHLFEVDQIGDVVGVLHQGRLFYEGPLPGLADAVRELHPSLPTSASLEQAFVTLAREVGG